MPFLVTISFGSDKEYRDDFYDNICVNCLIKMKCLRKIDTHGLSKEIPVYFIRTVNGCEEIKSVRKRIGLMNTQFFLCTRYEDK